MTRDEITAYVMALTPEQVCNESATRIMGWHLRDWAVRADGKPWVPVMVWSSEEMNEGCKEFSWRPDIDRNQSRMVTVRIIETVGGVDYLLAFGCALNTCLLSGDYFTLDGEVQILRVLQATPLDETRAALIAHMIHEEERKT